MFNNYARAEMGLNQCKWVQVQGNTSHILRFFTKC